MFGMSIHPFAYIDYRSSILITFVGRFRSKGRAAVHTPIRVTTTTVFLSNNTSADWSWLTSDTGFHFFFSYFLFQTVDISPTQLQIVIWKHENPLEGYRDDVILFQLYRKKKAGLKCLDNSENETHKCNIIINRDSNHSYSSICVCVCIHNIYS